MQLPELVTEERDQRIYDLRKSGFNYREIGRLLEISPSTAHAGFKRAAKKKREQYGSEMQDVGWLFLERYDTLLKNLIPFTKSQQIVDPESGERIQIPPSYDAVDRVVKVMASMQRMLGLDKETISLDMSGAGGVQVDSGESTGETSPEEFATKMLAELIKVGAMAGDDAAKLQALMGTNVIDAEVIEDTVTIENGVAHEQHLRVPSLLKEPPGESSEAPEWVDEDDEDYEPGEWLPEQLDDGGSIVGK